MPPQIVTPGEAFEAILGVVGRPEHRPPAGPIASSLAWSRAIREAHPGTIRALTRGHDADGGAPVDADALGATLARVHAEVGGHGLRFEAIARHARTVGGDAESERWLAMASIERAYAEILDGWGYRDTVVERLARLDGLEAEASSHGIASGRGMWGGAVGRVVLIGLPEMPGTVRRALEVAGRPVDALVHAPESERDAFDDLGCIRPEAWVERVLPIRDEQLVFASTRTDAVDRALAALTEPTPAPAAHEIVIGLADEGLGDLVRARASLYANLRFRDAAGTDPERTPPVRLLVRIAGLLAHRSYADLMALVRHPDVERVLLHASGGERGAWWLLALDEYGAAQIPGRLAHLPVPKESEQVEALRFVMHQMEALLGPLANSGFGTGAGPLEIGVCVQSVLGVLERVYGDEPLHANSPEGHAVAEACKSIVACAEELTAFAEATWNEPFRMEAHELIGTIVAEVGRRAIPEPPAAHAVEMIGWLELASDPSPVAVVVGMNEGAVPSAREMDPILPGSLRREAGVPGARERLARDSFLITTVASSRPFVRFIAPRRDDDGSPLMPSRLLLRTQPEALPARLSRAIGHEGDGSRAVVLRPLQLPAATSAFRTAVVAPAPKPKRMRVTSFRDYLASPYLFYLRHVLNLQERDAPDVEMDRLVFGQLVHEALDRFGKSDLRNSADARQVRGFVLEVVHQIARERFGTAPRALITVQVEHAAERLVAWAARQAERAGKGWRIVASEWSAPRDPPPVVATAAGDMAISGKIDRVDAHEEHGWAVLDYKTTDNGDGPESAHRRSGRWVDLQLPLYRTLVRPLAAEMGLTDEPALGFFNLPRRVGDTGVQLATWDAEDLATADALAAEVAAAVLQSRFEEVGDPNAGGTLGLLCGTGILEIAPEGSEGASEDVP